MIFLLQVEAHVSIGSVVRCASVCDQVYISRPHEAQCERYYGLSWSLATKLSSLRHLYNSAGR